jgi:hypothetical protein
MSMWSPHAYKKLVTSNCLCETKKSLTVTNSSSQSFVTHLDDIVKFCDASWNADLIIDLAHVQASMQYILTYSIPRMLQLWVPHRPAAHASRRLFHCNRCKI